MTLNFNLWFQNLKVKNEIKISEYNWSMSYTVYDLVSEISISRIIIVDLWQHKKDEDSNSIHQPSWFYWND